MNAACFLLAIELGLCLAKAHRLDKLSVTFHTHHTQNMNVNNFVINIAKSSIHKPGCLGNLFFFFSLVHYIDAICNYTVTCYYFHRTLDSFGAWNNQGSFNEYS